MADHDQEHLRSTALIKYREEAHAVAKRDKPLVSIPLARLAEGGRAIMAAIPEDVQERIGHVSRRSARICLGTAAVITVVLAVLVGGFYLRLMQGPISLQFLAPSLEQQLNAQLQGYRFRVADAILRLSDRWWLEFRLKDVSLLDGDGQEIAKAPLASVDVSLSALGAFSLAPSGIDLIGPKVLIFDRPEQGLAFSFSNAKSEAEGAAPGSGPSAAQAPDAAGVSRSAPPPLPEPGQIQPTAGLNLAGILDRLFQALGARDGASSYLTHFGIQKAAIYYVKDAGVTEWRVSDFEISLDESSKRSALKGEIAIDHGSAPWRMGFKVVSKPNSGTYSLSASVKDVVPRQVWNSVKEHAALKSFDMPLSADIRLDLNRSGEIRMVEADIALGKGLFYAPWDEKHPASIDSGTLQVRYTQDDGVAIVSPFELAWGDSVIRLAGAARRVGSEGEATSWTLDLDAEKFVLAAPQFGLPPIPIDEFGIMARYAPDTDRATLESLKLRAADAIIEIGGKVSNVSASPDISLTGSISPMPLAFFKLIWPTFVAHGARDWIGTNIPSGRIAGGNFAINLPASVLASLKKGGDVPDEAVSLNLRLYGLVVNHLKGLPPIRTVDSTARVIGRRFMFEVPGPAPVILPSGQTVTLSDGQFIVGDLRPRFPYGEVHFKAESEVGAALEFLDHPPLGYVRAVGMKTDILGGKVSSAFSIGMPLLKDLAFSQLSLSGKAQISDVRSNGLPGGFTVAGGNVNFDVSEKAVEASGDVTLNGVPVSLAWQRIFDAPPDRQPKLRIAGVLNDKNREDLGLKVNHMLKGNLPVALAVATRKDAPPQLSAEVNLTNSDLFLTAIGWRKPPGQRASLTFDVTPGEDGQVRLENFRMTGDGLSILGEVRLNAQRRLAGFDFSEFSPNALTQLVIRGNLTPDNVLKVHAKGPSYDGRQFFRSLFSAGKLAANQPGPLEDEPGLDASVEIDTVFGFFDTTVKSVAIETRRRNGKLSYLDVAGRLNGNAPVAVRVEQKAGQPRSLVAEATDAGAAFRLVGFYPAVRGGQMSLRVNLDGSGPAEKTGTLYAQNFLISGDQVVGQVVSRAEQEGARRNRAGRTPQGAVQGEALQFDRMVVPFSVGHGQFVLHDSAINGPLLGATMRGRIDFARDAINLSGTYVPLFGLNAVLGEVPILGDLLVSRRGEGILGITFAVQGRMANPDVLVNPVSMVAPGFLRQIFEFDNAPPQVIPRGEGKQQAPATKPQARAGTPTSRSE